MASTLAPHYYEIIFLGEPGVGKTCLFTRITKDVFVEDKERLTIGVDYEERTVSVNGEDVHIKLTDTGGGERFRTLTARYYRQAHAVILVYSVDSPATLSHIQEWIEDCNNQHPNHEQLLWVLVGNKADLINEVTQNQVEGLCKQFGIRHFYLTSAKTGENVEKMFMGVVKATHKAATKDGGLGSNKESSTISPTSTNNVVTVRKTGPSTASNKKCC